MGDLMDETRSLGTALPAEMARVRDELLPEYDAIGPSGRFGAMMLRRMTARTPQSARDPEAEAELRALRKPRES